MNCGWFLGVLGSYYFCCIFFYIRLILLILSNFVVYLFIFSDMGGIYYSNFA